MKRCSEVNRKADIIE
jgi:hypothetical protein